MMQLRPDDLSDPRIRDLISLHLADMHAGSPPESVHALGLEALADPSIQVFSAWVDEELAGVGALKTLDAQRGELKSMRVADAFRGTGVGRAILRHLLDAARERGLSSVWLETGSGPEFAPARNLYASEGFVPCGPFDAYTDDPLSVYLTRPV